MLRPLVIVENATLDALASDPRYVEVVPCFATFLARRKTAYAKGCSRCGRAAANRAASDAYNEAKQCIVGMDGDRKRRFKELLQTTQVRVVFTTTDGRMMKFTF